MNTVELARKIISMIDSGALLGEIRGFCATEIALCYEYRKLSDFVEGDTLHRNNQDRIIAEVKREEGYVGLWYKDHGVPQSVVDREDATYLALKRPEQVKPEEVSA